MTACCGGCPNGQVSAGSESGAADPLGTMRPGAQCLKQRQAVSPDGFQLNTDDAGGRVGRAFRTGFLEEGAPQHRRQPQYWSAHGSLRAQGRGGGPRWAASTTVRLTGRAGESMRTPAAASPSQVPEPMPPAGPCWAGTQRRRVPPEQERPRFERPGVT